MKNTEFPELIEVKQYLRQELDKRMKIIVAKSEDPSGTISDSFVNGWGYGASYILAMLDDYIKRGKKIWVFGHEGWVKVDKKDIKDIFELQNTRFKLK